MLTRTGSCWCRWLIASIVRGNVAEKNTVCRVCGSAAMISSMPGGNALPYAAATWASGRGSDVMCWVRMAMNVSPWNGRTPPKASYMITPIA